MLEALRAFLLGDDATGEASAPIDTRLASAVLLVQASSVDGTVAPEEDAMLRDLLGRRFALDAAAVDALIAEARVQDSEAVDFYAFTSILKRDLDEDGRLEIIEMLWRMAWADGEVHAFEDNLIWRVSELLGISARDRVLAKREVGREMRQDHGADETNG
ncbi:MAG: TerB family tellurite resistance protein [Pseudomonadota bacterium]